MAEEEKEPDSKSESTLPTKKTDPEKGKSRLVSPDPLRKKFITEVLHAFSKRKISFAEFTRMDPKKLRQIAELGYVKLRHGRFEEARKIFEVLCFIDHKNFFHHLSLAGAYQKLKKNVDAVYQYGETLKHAPGNTNALVNRGEIYLRMKNYRKAAEDFRDAIIADQTGEDRYANRARSLVVAIKRLLQKEKYDKEHPEEVKKIVAKRTVKPFRVTTSWRKK